MTIRVYCLSVRDNQRIPMNGEFRTLQHVRGRVARELRGLSSYYAVVVEDGDGNPLGQGVRAGLNGTGNRWVWEGAVAVPPRKR